MSEEIITDVAAFAFPFNKNVTLKNVAHDNGLNMLRVTLRENRRFTIFELDPASAAEFGKTLQDWATEHDT